MAQLTDAALYPEGLIYLPDHGAAFLHIPKTGGIWVRSILHDMFRVELLGSSHIHDYDDARRMCPDGTRFFTFVRHPLTWLQSYWCDRQLVGWGGDLKIAHHCVSNKFSIFAVNVETAYPGYIGDLFARYAKPDVLIGKFENLANDLELAFKAMGASDKQIDTVRSRAGSRLNEGSNRPDLAQKCVYTYAVREYVLEREHNTLERFGYTS